MTLPRTVGFAICLATCVLAMVWVVRQWDRPDDWLSLQTYERYRALIEAGAMEDAFDFAEAGYRETKGRFYARALAFHLLHREVDAPDLPTGIGLLREAAASGEWTSRFDLAIELLHRNAVDPTTGAATLNSRSELEPYEPIKILLSLSAEGYAPAQIALWRLTRTLPIQARHDRALRDAAALGHPTARLETLLLDGDGRDRCRMKDEMAQLAALGQIDAAHTVMECYLADPGPDTAYQALAWSYRISAMLNGGTTYGSPVDPVWYDARSAQLAADLGDADRVATAKEEARQWMERTFSAFPPQCNALCFMPERGFYLPGG